MLLVNILSKLSYVAFYSVLETQKIVHLQFIDVPKFSSKKQ